jgi:hypothetical protein
MFHVVVEETGATGVKCREIRAKWTIGNSVEKLKEIKKRVPLNNYAQ